MQNSEIWYYKYLKYKNKYKLLLIHSDLKKIKNQNYLNLFYQSFHILKKL
jgi:hypothetical protein